MKKMIGAVLVLFLITVDGMAEEKKIDLTSTRDKISYSIGTRIGNDFSRQQLDINPDILIQGIKDAMAGDEMLMTEAQIQDVLRKFQQEQMAAQQAQMKVIGEKNAKEGAAFLAENAKKDGVVTLPSGLQYKILTKGKGKNPTPTDTVTVNYRGTLIDGREFDSSYKRGQPATFSVNGVIPGWTEALQLMKAGAKWQLFIPGELAYGERGAGQTIGPNATLIFDVELISIK
ncbi:Mip: outer membrane protein MIP (peptidyl-proly cis-trans isomerase, FKBP-type) [Desulfosarcina variabilis str. Montpellier]